MRIVALDLETTGLSPQHDAILQLAMVEVDPETLIPTRHHFVMDVQASADELGLMNDFVRDMHTMTGLLARQDMASDRCLVLRAALAWMGPVQNEVYVLGDSVHFDIAFLRVHMPSLAARFSYRIIDTTSIWLGLGLEQPETACALEHDALADAMYSIEKLKAFRKQVKGGPS